jgi:inorganic triphosphatase YgiF
LLHLGGAKRDTAVVELSFPSSLLGKGSALANHPLKGQGRLPVSYEIELKLAVPASKLEKLERALLALPTARLEAQSDLVSTYYDTRTLALHRRGLTLRVRRQGRKFVQTIKADDPAKSDLLERREWEAPIESSQPNLDALKIGRRLPDAIHEEDLRPVFTTTVTRKTIELNPTPTTEIVVAIDQGEIRTADGTGIEPISEIELELKRGDPAAVYDLALQLLKIAEVRIETRSKAERGYRLFRAASDEPRAVQAGTVTLDRNMTVEAALQRFGQRCLTHLLRNEPVTLAGEPEGIHQMRVAVRRLRSALTAVKPMLPVEHHRWASEELKWLTDSLAPARNWDVFVGDLLRTVTDALSNRPELQQLVSAANRCNRAALDDAKQAILSERYTDAMLRLLRWFAVPGWRDQPISENAILLLAPIVSVAPSVLERRYRKARRRCKRFEQLAPAERHRLRIALKKLRYTIEFLGSLFDKHGVQVFVDRLKSLQDDLGHANDVRIAYDLLEQMQQTRDQTKDHFASTIDRAGGIVLGWHERDLADREPLLRKHIKRFKRLDPFW